jgi:pilus assembly protein Flp/PilA
VTGFPFDHWIIMKTVIFANEIFRQLLADDSGQDLIEYALVAALIGLGAILALRNLSTHIDNSFSSVSSTLTSNI